MGCRILGVARIIRPARATMEAMNNRRFLSLVSTVLLALGLAVLPACGKKGAAAGGAETVDLAALKEGASHTAKLKFWAKNRGLAGEELVDNVHFDDAKNQRVALRFDPALGDKVGKLEQGKTYTVTFTVKDDTVHKGTMTAVE